MNFKRNLVLFLFLPTMGIVFYYLGSKFREGIKKSFLNLIIILFIALDQSIKLIFLNIEKIGIIPVKNHAYSTFNQLFNINISIIGLIVINLILIMVSIWGYKIHIKSYGKSLWSDFFIIFICSGLICSLLDKVFWNGSVDFINFSNLIIFDFKDVYLVMSIFLLIFEMILNDNIDIFTKQNR